MEAGHHLKIVLQIQLASDLSAAHNLPFVLNSLTPQSFIPSAHLSKWTTRISSLLHSKEAPARWAGLCIAHKTATCSQSLTVEYGQSWLGVALPLLSKNEPVPVTKAAIRLARLIFTSLTNMPEFQRQVSNPNVPKFIGSLIQLAEKNIDLEVKLECLWTLSRLVPIYPAVHRASHSALSKLALGHLNGDTMGTSHRLLVEASSALYCVLHFTGGKVGAAGLWRSSLDETLDFGWNSFWALRTTFPSSGISIPREQDSHADPSVSIPLNVDRLACSITILRDLLRAVTLRHIQLPLGSIVQFAMTLLTADTETKVDGFIDPTVRSMEITAVPLIMKHGSRLLRALAYSARSHLSSHATRLLTAISQCLEMKPSSDVRIALFDAVDSILQFTLPLGAPLVLNRIAMTVIPFISTLLLSPPPSLNNATKEASSIKSRKGKKRTRNYEGDEVFSVTREVMCSTQADGRALIASLNVLHRLLLTEELSSAALSICSKTILSLNLTLPQTAPHLLSPDTGLYLQVYSNVRKLATDVACGTSSTLSKSLPLVMENIENDRDEERVFDLLLHPRAPPLLRSMPSVEALSLYRSEESQEERNILNSLGLEMLQDTSKDVAMADDYSECPDVSSSSGPIPLAPVPTSSPTPVPTPLLAPAPTSTTGGLAALPESRQEDSRIAVFSETKATVMTTKVSEREHIDPELSLVPNSYQPSTQQLSTTANPLNSDDSDDDDDTEMPTIDMASDSEEDI